MKKLTLSLIIIAIVFILTTLSIRTFVIDKYSTTTFQVPEIENPSQEALNRFSNGLKFKTIADIDYEKTDFAEFEEFIKYIQKAYPDIQNKCEFKLINKYGILIKLKGNSSIAPTLLAAHYDVVGVKDASNWIHPPFSGYYDNEYIYSRGTIDDKGSVFAILEALNDLCKSNFIPKNDIYVAFSQTEETGSDQGAKKFIKYFKDNNIKFNTVLDEGSRIIERNGKYYACISNCEKGRLVSKITVHGNSRHASIPNKDFAVLDISFLIRKFASQPSKAELHPDVYTYYLKTFQSYSLPLKILIANKVICKPILIYTLSKSPDGNARIRATHAVTMVEGSNSQNVVSNTASIIVDTRILPTQTVEQAKKEVESIVHKTLPKKRVTIEYLSSIPTSLPTNSNGDSFKSLSKDINTIYPNIIQTPYMTTGATDARDYALISKNTFRFLPCILKDTEYQLMHSDNEKISIKNWARMIKFYKLFIQNR